MAIKQDTFKQYSDNDLRSIRRTLVASNIGYLPYFIAKFILTENPTIGNQLSRITRCINLIDREIVSRFIKVDDRRYPEPYDSTNCGTVMTVKTYLEGHSNGDFQACDGSGYWMLDGFVSTDEVDESSPQDATHVVWYNN